MSENQIMLQRRSAPPQIEALHGLRFFAALHVMFFHFFAQYDVPTFLHGFVKKGMLSVSLFFILSGFVLSYRYGSELMSRTFRPKTYAVGRIARIYPVYLFSTLLCLPFAIAPHLAGAPGETLGDFMAQRLIPHLFLAQAWHPALKDGVNMVAWSLSVEVVFYALFPLLCVQLMRSIDRMGIWTTMLAIYLAASIPGVVSLISGGAGNETMATIVGVNPLVRLPEFMFGVCLAMAGRYVRVDRGKTVYVSILSALIVYACISMLPNVDGVVMRILLMPVYGSMILSLTTTNNGVARVFSGRAIGLLGRSSYALYLTHVPVFMIVYSAQKSSFNLSDASLLLRVLLIFISIAASILVFLAVERPANKAVRRFVELRRRGALRAQHTGVKAN